MGTNKLKNIVRQEDRPLEYFSGNTVAIDGYITLYQFLTAITGSDGDSVRNGNGDPVSHLIGMLGRFTKFKQYDIKPILVLDGTPPAIKNEELERRRQRKENAEAKYAQAKAEGDEAGMKKWGRAKTSINDFVLDSTEAFCDVMGIPVHQAATEGEAQAAQFVREQVADYAVSTDYDTLLYGSSMIRGLGTNGGERIPLVQSLKESDLTQEQLLWYGVLSGTDYNASPHGIGPVTAEKIVRRVDDFDEIVDIASERDDDIDIDRYHAAYNWYSDPDVNTDLSPEWGGVDTDLGHQLLVEVYEIQSSQVEGAFNRMETYEW